MYDLGRHGLPLEKRLFLGVIWEGEHSGRPRSSDTGSTIVVSSFPQHDPSTKITCVSDSASGNLVSALFRSNDHRRNALSDSCESPCHKKMNRETHPDPDK